MLTAIAIPEQLATARLAGFPPEAGLIAFCFGGMTFALLGRNRFLSVGADSTIAPIFAGAIASLGAGAGNYTALASMVALLSGGALVVAGIARAGWIADLLSRPVIIGFLAGISVHIIVGQLPSLLGVRDVQGPLLWRLVGLLREAPHANLYTFLIGTGVVAVTILAARISERIPGALIALGGAGAAYSLLQLGARGVPAIGVLHLRVPKPALPPLHDEQHLLAIFPLALIIALICIVQSSAVTRAFPSDEGAEEDPAPDFAAIGAGSILSGLFGAFAVNGSPPRTALVAQSGGKSQLSTVVAICAVAAVAAFFAGFGKYVPTPALAGVLIFVAFRLFRVRDMMNVATYSPREFSLLISSALLIVVFPIETGVFFAIALSLLHGITLIMWPSSTKLVHQPGTTVWWPPAQNAGESETPGVLVFAPAAPLNFTNAAYVNRKLLEALHSEPQPVSLLVIEASGVTDIDYTASQKAQQTIRDLRSHGTDVAIARLISQHAQERAAQSGLIQVLGADHVFRTVQEAIDTLGTRAQYIPGTRGG